MKNFDNEGPILLFEHAKDYENRIVANVCGTRKRTCANLDVNPDELYGTLTQAWQVPRKPRIFADRVVKKCLEDCVDLRTFPFLTHFEKDA